MHPKNRSNFQVNQLKGIRLSIAKTYLFAFVFFDLLLCKMENKFAKKDFFLLSNYYFCAIRKVKKRFFTHMLHYRLTCNAKIDCKKTYRLRDFFAQHEVCLALSIWTIIESLTVNATKWVKIDLLMQKHYCLSMIS